ncbi:MAG: mitofilin family membrane protein [Parvibaculum sp.]|jgi:hypothetical protein|uniref:COG4223 family protein n=1 Tax=Parvibaculum sp. TaxID=2024848 RepID=UPI003265F571
MSDSDDKNGSTPKDETSAGSGDAAKPKDAEAEYLKPENGSPKRKSTHRKEPRVLEGTAEDVSGEAEDEAPKAAEPEPSSGANGTAARSSGILVAGVAGVAGAAVTLAAIWAAGVLPLAQDDDRFADLQARLDTIEASGGDASREIAEKVDALTVRVGAAEEGLAAAAERPDSAAAIGEQLDALASDLQEIEAALSDTRGTMSELGQKVEGIEGRLPPDGIGDQVGALDSLVKALDLRLASLAPEIEKMESRVAALEEEAEDPDAAARAALGLALANLARAAESSGSFETELGVVQTFLPDEAALGELSDAAAGGVPTRAALEARFPSLAQGIFDAERHANDDNWWSRLTANAKSLVTIRRTGEISGDTTEAIVARMEERLKVHDLEGAVAEAETLSGPAADAAAPWIADAKARLETDRLVRELSARVSEQLAKARG